MRRPRSSRSQQQQAASLLRLTASSTALPDNNNMYNKKHSSKSTTPSSATLPILSSTPPTSLGAATNAAHRQPRKVRVYSFLSTPQSVHTCLLPALLRQVKRQGRTAFLGAGRIRKVTEHNVSSLIKEHPHYDLYIETPGVGGMMARLKDMHKYIFGTKEKMIITVQFGMDDEVGQKMELPKNATVKQLGKHLAKQLKCTRQELCLISLEALHLAQKWPRILPQKKIKQQEDIGLLLPEKKKLQPGDNVMLLVNKSSPTSFAQDLQLEDEKSETSDAAFSGQIETWPTVNNLLGETWKMPSVQTLYLRTRAMRTFQIVDENLRSWAYGAEPAPFRVPNNLVWITTLLARSTNEQGVKILRGWLRVAVPVILDVVGGTLGTPEWRFCVERFPGGFGKLVQAELDSIGFTAPMFADLKRRCEATEVHQGRMIEKAFKSFVGSGDEAWNKLASLESQPVTVSQLDVMPDELIRYILEDCKKHDPGFGSLFPLETLADGLSKQFENAVRKALTTGRTRMGPGKTRDRSKAKVAEYYDLSIRTPRLPRWVAFEKRCEERNVMPLMYQNHFGFAITDWVRCSVTVSDARQVFQVLEELKKAYPILALKNGYNANKTDVPQSGYRDIKVILDWHTDTPVFGIKEGINMICEVQIVLHAWLDIKKRTNFSYKIRRANSTQDLVMDFEHFLDKAYKNGSLKRGKEKAEFQRTQLMVSAYNGNLKRVKQCLEYPIYRAQVNRVDWHGCSAVYLAAQQGHLEVIRTILSHRADVDLACDNGSSPLGMAARNGHYDVVDLLLRNNANPNHQMLNGGLAITLAAKRGHAAVVNLLIASGADVDKRDGSQGTALTKAARHGHANVVGILLAAGANRALKEQGWNALRLARYYNHEEVIDALQNAA